MDTISSGNVVPWLIDPTYLVQLVELSMLVVVLLTIAGLAYAGLYHLLSNRTNHGSAPSERARSSRCITDVQTGVAWSPTPNAAFKEGIYDEV